MMFGALRTVFGDPTPEERLARAFDTLKDPNSALQEAAAALVTLGQSTDSEAWALVHSFASTPAAHPHLQQSAAEALADILLRQGFKADLIRGLTPGASEAVVAFLMASDPSLGNQVAKALS
jgi:hypothetical protein